MNPARKRKNLVNAKWVSITPRFFHKISKGSEALCTIIIFSESV
jgi:hypothetical protein